MIRSRSLWSDLFGKGFERNFESCSPYRHGSSTALVRPIRTPATMSALPVRACSAIGGAIERQSVVRDGDAERFRQFARTRTQRALVVQPAPAAHRRYPMGRLQRTDQDRAGRALFFADEIDAPMDAVGAIDIGKARRPEHHAVARRRPAKRMRGRLGVVIGLDLDDDAADAVDQQRRADQVGRDLDARCGRRTRASAACPGRAKSARRVRISNHFQGTVANNGESCTYVARSARLSEPGCGFPSERIS